MNIAAVFIAYFGIKETQFHPDTGACRGQYHADAQPTLTEPLVHGDVDLALVPSLYIIYVHADVLDIRVQCHAIYNLVNIEFFIDIYSAS